jgi:CHAT domain-containing protein
VLVILMTMLLAPTILLHREPVNVDREARAIRSALRELAETATGRFAEARLADPFEDWNPSPSASRGEERSVDSAVVAAALNVYQAAKQESGALAARARGIAYLALGDLEAAVAALEDATEQDESDVAAHLDLSAALIERWRRQGTPFDAVRALDLTGWVLTHQPSSAAATFNQALVLEYLGARDSAIATWGRYLRVDPATPWGGEARRHTGALQDIQRGAWTSRESMSDAAIERAVAADPFDIYNFIEYEVLSGWAAAVLAGGEFDTTLADRCARALHRAGRDSYPAILTAAVRESSGWPLARRRKLAEGIRDVFEWRTLIDDGHYQEAEPLGARAAAALQAVGVDPAEAELEIAYSDLGAGRTREALARLPRLELDAKARGYWRIAAKAARLRALADMLATRVAEGQDRYHGGLDLAERAGDVELFALFHSFLGEAYELQGDVLSSWSHFAPALRALPRLFTTRQRFVTLNGAAAAARNAGLHHAALVFAEALLASTSHWNNPEGQIGGRLARARALYELNLADRGVADLDVAASLLPRLASRPQAQDRLRAEVAAYRSFSLMGRDDRAALAASDLALTFFGDSVRMRLAELLLQRGRIHMRLGQAAEATRYWLRGVDIVEDQRSSLRDELLRVSRRAAIWDLYTELVDQARFDARRALELLERSHARELLYSLNPNQTSEAVSLDEVQRALPAGVQAIVYAQLSSRLLIWRVTNTQVTLTEQPISAQRLRRQVAAFVSGLDGETAARAASELGRTLLPPGLQTDGRPLVIVPDGALHRVPFSALPVGDGRVLVQAAVPVITPSLSTFVLSAVTARHATSRSIVAVGVDSPAPSEGLPRLANAESEARFVSGLYPQHESLTGGQARKSAVLDAFTKHAVIHFAGHALLNPMFPAQSRLVLADGDAITPRDVAALELQPGTLAVLGACDTALGRTFNGEGPMSLVRAFLVAGASSVVASLWKVRDDDATRLLRLLHARLAEGADLARSLAASQRELIHAGYPPSAWSGFTVVGSITTERTH